MDISYVLFQIVIISLGVFSGQMLFHKFSAKKGRR